MRNLGPLVITASLVVIVAVSLAAQGVPAAQQVPPTAQPAPPPATKLEGFKPAAGQVMTVGYDELGKIGVGYGISVDAREMRDAKGAGARGLVVEVVESQYREERSFVDADEIPELLKALDTLLEVKANPTQFKMFEVRYSTRGDLEVVAFSDAKGNIKYVVQAGRVLKAKKFLDGEDLLKLRKLFDAALQKLSATSSK